MQKFRCGHKGYEDVMRLKTNDIYTSYYNALCYMFRREITFLRERRQCKTGYIYIVMKCDIRH